MLKTILERKKREIKEAELAKKRKELAEVEREERELEVAIEELDPEADEADKKVVENLVNDLVDRKEEISKAAKILEDEIKKIDETIAELEKAQEGASKKTEPEGEEVEIIEEGKRGEKRIMSKRKAFFGMTKRETAEFIKRDDVQKWLSNVRAIAEKRAVKGADLLIPTVVLELIRENIEDYSKLIRRVNLRPVAGKARQPIMGTIPEAVWTEACASLNELEFNFNVAEVDAYKVGGYVFVCKSTLEDADIDLAAELIAGIGAAIGIAIDKAIIYGTGKKMLLGIAARLGQTEEPDNYPANARPWENLSGNIITIPEASHGLDFFKALVLAGGKAKGKYSRGIKFWVMNETTYTTIKVEAMNFNNSAAIVSALDGTMPVAGGDIVVLSDDIIPDGNIVGGFGDLYLLAERAQAELNRSDEYRFVEEQSTFKGTARYDGLPVIPEAFVAIGLGTAPQSSAVFAGDTANDASLQDLTIGSETLTPEFSSNVYKYTVTATDTKGAISAIPNQTGKATEIKVKYNDKNVNNGAEITFVAGTKPIEVTVARGNSKLVYTINVTKAAAKQSKETSDKEEEK